MKLQFPALFLMYFFTHPVTSDDELGDWLFAVNLSGQVTPATIMPLLDQIKASDWKEKKRIPDTKLLEIFKLRFVGEACEKFFAVFRPKETSESKKLTILITGSLVTSFKEKKIIANNAEFCLDSDSAVKVSIEQYLASTPPGPFIQEIIPESYTILFKKLNKSNDIMAVGAAKGTTDQVLIAVRERNNWSTTGIYTAIMEGDVKFFWVVVTCNIGCEYNVESTQRFLSNSKEDACAESEKYYAARDFPTVLKRQAKKDVPKSEKVFFDEMRVEIQDLSKIQQKCGDRLMTSVMTLLEVHSAYNRYGLVGVIWVFNSHDDGILQENYHCWAAIEVEVITGRRFLRQVGTRRRFQCFIWNEIDTYLRSPFPFSPKWEYPTWPTWSASLRAANVFSTQVLSLRGWNANYNSSQTIIGFSATNNIVLLKQIRRTGNAYFVIFLRRQCDEIYIFELVYVSPLVDECRLDCEIRNYALAFDLNENALEDWNTKDYSMPEEYMTELKNAIAKENSSSSNHTDLTTVLATTLTAHKIGVNADDPDKLQIEKAQTVSISPNGHNIIAIVRNENYRAFVAFTVEFNPPKIIIAKYEKDSGDVRIEDLAESYKDNVFAFSPPKWAIVSNAEDATGWLAPVITAVQNILAWNYSASKVTAFRMRPVMKGQGGSLVCVIFTATDGNSERIDVAVIAQKSPYRKLLYVTQKLTHVRSDTRATNSFNGVNTDSLQDTHTTSETSSTSSIISDRKEDAEITSELDKFFKSKFHIRGVEDWVLAAAICDSSKAKLNELIPDIDEWLLSVEGKKIPGLKFRKMKHVNSSGTKLLLVYEYINSEKNTDFIIVSALRYFFLRPDNDCELRLLNVSTDFEYVSQAQLCIDPFNIEWETKPLTYRTEEYLQVVTNVEKLVKWRTVLQDMKLVEVVTIKNKIQICFYIFEVEISNRTQRMFAAYSGSTLQYLSPAVHKLSLWNSILSYRQHLPLELESLTRKEDLPKSTIKIIKDLIKISNDSGGYKIGMFKKLILNYDHFVSARNLGSEENNRKRLFFEQPENDSTVLITKKKPLYADIVFSKGEWTIQHVCKEDQKTH